MSINIKKTIGNESIEIETGKWAKQADGSVVYRNGNLVLLATVCATSESREGQDFFPLTVEYTEKMYSVGRFPGGYIKRESKPSEHEVLTSRLIDRPIRPMFPEGYFCEVQIMVQVLSSDKTISIAGHALNAASAALMSSDIPFSGPLAAVRVGRIDGQYKINPSVQEMINSDMDLILAGDETSIVMIEGEARELTNKELLDGLKFGHDAIIEFVKMQKEFSALVNKPKREVNLRKMDPGLVQKVRDFALENLSKANLNDDKQTRSKEIKEINDKTIEHFKSENCSDEEIKSIKNYLHELEAEVVRELIFKKGIRYDGRKLDEVRPISVETNVLPGAHGSAVFTRGQTQSLGVMTLGSISDNQRYENLEGAKEKTFMLHYNFPAFSVGEVRKNTGPGRREIGHGNLAERALKNMVPKFQEFPYVIRLVSEILESNGSSSMASVCSGSLAMMSGGVPMKSSVAGVAMGLITSDDKKDFAVLTDIAGIEDHFGDMDFKLAGTRTGITAFQMDLKITGIGFDILEKVFLQAEAGRNHILDEMEKSISSSVKELSTNAPRITIKSIPKERIGELIGPGGKTIRSIIEQSKADINIDDEGNVTIASPDLESSNKAISIIDSLFEEIEIGKIYQGKVKRIADFGAFVEILPGKEGLVHISKLDSKRVNSVRDIVKEGEIIPVKVLGLDRTGKIDLSRKDALSSN
ncbi:MAG: polyribonucleotide nucleotidyltransferase [Leptospiraceae bacterium]|nr:polyribonucleotide nucleotidyltransferase [Leptospiraceae bacterium]MCP5513237.1 polyribonucleotide nucleotidyltransferase [Leptospiraceae bacterium]